MGCSDITTEGVWIWTNSSVSFDSTIFKSVQLNDYDNTFDDSRRFSADCGLYVTTTHLFYDINCESPRPFICALQSI